MEKQKFILLSIDEKTDLLWNYGELISEKVYYECNISLFLLESYYVEVFFNRVLNEIISIEIQENNQILYDYVKHIDITQLQKK